MSPNTFRKHRTTEILCAVVRTKAIRTFDLGLPFHGALCPIFTGQVDKTDTDKQEKPISWQRFLHVGQRGVFGWIKLKEKNTEARFDIIVRTPNKVLVEKEKGRR